MMSNVNPQIGFCTCPNCGTQFALMAGPMPGMMWGQAPGMMGSQMPGMMGSQMPGMMGSQMPGMMGSQMPGMMGSQMPAMQGQMPGMPTAGGGAGTWWGPSATYDWTYTADDEEIEEMVHNAIETDPSVPRNVDINVSVDGGIVTLTGTVPSKRIKHAIGDDAWWIPDVIDVNNQLTVSPRKERMRQKGETEQTAQAQA